MKAEIACNLKDYRTQYRLTQEKLAFDLNVSRQTIISIERRRHTPSLSLAFRIVQYFQCSFEEMFSLEKEEDFGSDKKPAYRSRNEGERGEDSPLPMRSLPFLD